MWYVAESAIEKNIVDRLTPVNFMRQLRMESTYSSGKTVDERTCVKKGEEH